MSWSFHIQVLFFQQCNQKCFDSGQMTKYPPYFLCLEDDDRVVGTVTDTEAGFRRNHGFIPNRERNLLFSTLSFLYECWVFIPGGKAADA